MLSTPGFIFLASILNTTLYVTKPDDVVQCSVVVDYDKSLNDTYLQKWEVMKLGKNYCNIALRNNLNDVFIRYKTRYVFRNQSHWLPNKHWS